MANGILPLHSSTARLEGRVVWSSVANQTTNSSTVSYSVQMRRLDGEARSMRWDGSVEAWNYNYNFDGENPFYENHWLNRAIRTDEQWNTIDSGSFSILHDDDGTSWVGFWVNLKDPLPMGERIDTDADADDYTMYLDTIVRPASITSAPDITDATSTATIKYSNPMGSGAKALEVCIANETGNTILVPYRAVNKTGSSYVFNLSSTERQALVNNVKSGNTATIRYYIKLTDIDGGEHRHFITKTFTLTTAMPTISATIADMNETTKALTGDYNTLIRYMSNAAVSINAVAKEGATIVRCDCECGSFNAYNTNGIFQVPRVETGVFTVKATDSRGNKVSQTIQKTMMLYEKVSCNLGVSMRSDGSTGAIATLNIRGNYYNGKFGTTSAAQSNSITLQYRYGAVEGSWGSWKSITVPTSAMSNNQYNISKDIEDLDYQTRYRFQCYVADKLTTAYSEEIERKLQPVFDWSGENFNFNVPVYFNGTVMNDFIVEQGTEPMGTNGTWYWFKYNSGRSECYGRRNFGNMGISTALGAMYRSTALTQDLPQGVFLTNSIPDYIGMNMVANGTGWICRDGSGYSPSYSTTGSFYVVSPTSGNQSAVWLSFHVMGRWK